MAHWALCGGNPIHACCERLVARGKPKKLALVAAAHKLLARAWAVFISGEPIDAINRCHQDRQAGHLTLLFMRASELSPMGVGLLPMQLRLPRSPRECAAM